jgi:hypothetical protein
MINLEALADNSVSDRNFQKLARLVPDTGGLSVALRSGAVSAAGAITAGTGFTVTKNGTGDYSVNLTFARAPIVVVGSGTTAANLAAKLNALTAPSTAGFRVLTFATSTNTATDGAFHWVAIG